MWFQMKSSADTDTKNFHENKTLAKIKIESQNVKIIISVVKVS